MRRDVLAALGRRRSAPAPLVLDFRRNNEFGFFFEGSPPGCVYTRASSVSSAQRGNTLLATFPTPQADLLLFGRADDTWDVGAILEEARTNVIPDASNYAAASWTLTGSVTRTGAQAGPTGANAATRLEAAAGSNFLYRAATSLSGSYAVSQWMRPSVPPADVGLLSGGTTVGRDEVLAAPAAWRRYAATGVTPSAGSINSFGVDSRNNFLTFGGGARDWTVYGHQLELGGYPTELIPTSGGAATRAAAYLRVLGATWSPWIVGGRVGVELWLRPKGARSEYSGTRYLWWQDSNNHVALDPSTGVLTVTIAGASNTTAAVTWARYDEVRVYIEAGGSLPALVQVLVNGVRSTPSVTGSSLGSVSAGDLYLRSSSSGGHVCSWVYWCTFWQPGTRPAWAW